MFAYLEGHIKEHSDTSCVIATNLGVGYEVFVPIHTRAVLPKKGELLQLYICHIVREDSQELFGFETWDERQTFIILISISKVGARTALNILSTFRPDELRQRVLEEDILALTRVSGIGKKTAQHIFLELKYKLKSSSSDTPFVGSSIAQSVYHDVLIGLQGLGYMEEEAVPILRNVLQAEPDLDVSGALRSCLKQLVKSC